MLRIRLSVSPLGLPREVLKLAADPLEIELRVVHLVPARGEQPRQLLEDERRNLDGTEERTPVLTEPGEGLELLAELLLIPHDRSECLVEIIGRVTGPLDPSGHVQPHQIRVSTPVAEPPPHLHEGVPLSRPALEISDGQPLEGEPPTELRAADEDSPDPIPLEVDLVVLLVLVTIDDDDRVSATGHDEVEHLADEWSHVLEGFRKGQVVLPLPGGGDDGEVLIEELAQRIIRCGGPVSRLLPQATDPIPELGVLRLLDGLVHQHRVVAEGTLQRGSSRGPPQFDRPGEHEGVQSLAQLLLHALRIGVVVTAQTADEGLLVRDGRIVLLLIGELLEVVIGPTAPVRLRGAQAHDEVAGEDVLGVLR